LDVVLLTSRLLLAVVFVLAGVTKLLDPSGSRQALASFGVPARLSPSIGLLLPLAELVVAVALIPRPTAWWGALGAFTLLSLFVIGIAVTLARGEAPDCHCFGQLYSEPVGRSTLARNIALAALAGFVLWQGWGDPGTSSVAWIGRISVAERALLLAVAIVTAGMIAEGWILLNLVQQNGRLLLRLDDLEARLGATGQVPAVPPVPAPSAKGLPIGSVAPAFMLRDLEEEPVTLADLLAPGKPVFLVFSDPGCGPCTALMPDVATWQQPGSRLTVAVISRGTPESNRAKLADLGIRHILLQRDRETAQAYGAPATPSAVLVQSDGTIGSGVALGPAAIQTLIDPWVEESPRTPLATVDSGKQVPATYT
jgi:peroxiredoxin